MEGFITGRSAGRRDLERCSLRLGALQPASRLPLTPTTAPPWASLEAPYTLQVCPPAICVRNGKIVV